jgi:hypothetical protein
MRMRSVRHFSRALHQVSVCIITSARHSQVRSPNMRTSRHIVAVSVRVVHICSSKSWLTWTNATSRNDLQTANTLIPRKHHAADITAIDDFSCTETQADGSYSEGIPKRLFFFSRCRDEQQQAKQQKFCPNEPGGRARLFFSFYFIYLFYLINLIN